MPAPLARRLTSSDAAFLYFERRNAPLHIGSLGVYEGEIPFERFSRHIESRLPLIPRYRQRIAAVPFNLAHPTWEDDPDFRIDRHIFHVSMPSPGTDEQLRALCCGLFAPPLDRSKPLWEMFVIHGLEGGRTGILSKVHHCMVDGVSGIELLIAVLDITPEPAPPPDSPPWEPKPLPDLAQRMSAAFWDNLAGQRERLRDVQETMLHPRMRIRQLLDLLRAANTSWPWLSRPAPRTPLTASIGDSRTVAFSEVSFVEIREIRTSLGGTVNDVVLAVLAGALRRYLSDRGYDIAGDEPRVGIPVNVRVEGDQGSLGNRVSLMVTPLPLAEPDPLERFRLIRERCDEAKRDNQAGATELLIQLSAATPAPIQAAWGMLPPVNTLINLICTNVPGPMIPLYSVGHLMLAHYPMVPLAFDMGLGVGVTSYNQRLYFGLMADPKAVPDIDVLKGYVDESFLELRRAAGVSATDLPPLGGNGAPGVKVPAEAPA
jgi:WS/DGAT/MGAT family acyltransferase